MLVVSIVTTVAILVPGAAQAEVVGETVTWTGAVSTNEYDPYYDTTAIAFTEGATATVSFAWFNNIGNWVTARPYIEMDWGQRYYGSTVNVAPFQATTMSISFTVPAIATAGGPIKHGYFMYVEGEMQGNPFIVNREVGEGWTAPGGDDTYVLNYSPVIGSSVEVWKEDFGDTGYEWVSPDDYTVDEWTAEVDFDATPDAGTVFLFTYNYYQYIGTGDGDTTTFTVMPPMGAEMKTGTLAVYLTNDADEEVEQHTTGWTYDVKSGLLVFDTAPTPNQSILVRFEYYMTFPGAWTSNDGGTFVIFSADQTAAITAWRRYMEMREAEDVGGWDSAQAQLLWSQAEAARAKGEIEYREGQFAAANASMQAALTALNGSITAAVDYMKLEEQAEQAAWAAELASMQAQAASDNADVFYRQGQTAYMVKQGTNLDAETAWLNAQTANLQAMTSAEKALVEAEAKQAKGEAAMYSNIGIFMVMVAVALLLAAIGGILWAYSRLVEAKRPGQQP